MSYALIATIMLAASTAAAEPISIAAGVNAPFRWELVDTDSFDAETDRAVGSLHVGFGGHHAIRATLSSFPYRRNMVDVAFSSALEGNNSLKEGRVDEAGVGYQWFPRALWSGAVLEAGLLRRAIDGSEDYRSSGPEHVETHGVGYAGRALVGWSWLIKKHVFVATSVGLAIGRYSGTETTLPYLGDDMSEAMTGRFTRWQTTPEFYFRIGGALNL